MVTVGGMAADVVWCNLHWPLRLLVLLTLAAFGWLPCDLPRLAHSAIFDLPGPNSGSVMRLDFHRSFDDDRKEQGRMSAVTHPGGVGTRPSHIFAPPKDQGLLDPSGSIEFKRSFKRAQRRLALHGYRESESEEDEALQLECSDPHLRGFCGTAAMGHGSGP